MNQQPKKYTSLELIQMNRHDRRRFGKQIAMKIPGIQDKHLEQKKNEVMKGFNRNFINKDNIKKDSLLNIAELKV